MKTLRNTLLASALIIGISSHAYAQCNLPAGPIIPDGNVASQDELVGAQKRLKEFQQNLISYRDCLTSESKAIEGEGVEAEAKQAAILELYNQSVEIEEKKATQFNSAVRAFKQR